MQEVMLCDFIDTSLLKPLNDNLQQGFGEVKTDASSTYT